MTDQTDRILKNWFNWSEDQPYATVEFHANKRFGLEVIYARSTGWYIRERFEFDEFLNLLFDHYFDHIHPHQPYAHPRDRLWRKSEGFARWISETCPALPRHSPMWYDLYHNAFDYYESDDAEWSFEQAVLLINRLLDDTKDAETSHFYEVWDHWAWNTEVGGLYGDGMPMVFSTRGHPSSLYDDIDVIYMEIDGETHCIIDGWAFADNGSYSLPGLDYNDGNLHCPGCGANWYTDDGGYNWYAASSEYGSLKDYPVVDREEDLLELADELEAREYLEPAPVLEALPGLRPYVREINRHRRYTRAQAQQEILRLRHLGMAGTVVVDGRDAFCPVCGERRLEAW